EIRLVRRQLTNHRRRHPQTNRQRRVPRTRNPQSPIRNPDMPSRQPFTRLCQQLARPASSGRADLHLHTTHSDGTYSPAEVVDLARRSGLAAVAITDHDTTAGVAPARAAAALGLEVIAGVEVTAEYQGREAHLLGYFVRPDDRALSIALDRL